MGQSELAVSMIPDERMDALCAKVAKYLQGVAPDSYDCVRITAAICAWTIFDSVGGDKKKAQSALDATYEWMSDIINKLPPQINQ
jgi:hypothetical protein